MDTSRFDRVTRALTTAPTRRLLLQSLVAAILGLASAPPPSAVHAGKRKAKLRFNQFGCVDVGGKCRGKDKNCCSAICQGKKPKKGEKDKSRCVAHGTGGCQAGQQEPFCGGANVICTTSTSTTPNGVCATTTGNAGYCAFTATCSPCRKDADCRPVCGPGAACVKCANCIEDGGTRCVGIGPAGCTFD